MTWKLNKLAYDDVAVTAESKEKLEHALTAVSYTHLDVYKRQV